MSLKRMLISSVNLLPWGIRDNIRKIPVVAGLQRWLVRNAMSGETFEHRINAGPASGLKMLLTLPEDKAYWTGTCELDVTTCLVGEMQKGAVCYDIGSHRGFIAGVMAINGASEVFCFEPNPDNIESIGQLTRLNPDLTLTVKQMAVGAEDGNATFEIMPETSMGKLSTSTFQDGVGGQRTIDVQIVSLDSMLSRQEISPPSMMKIDIEGAEFDALCGADKLISEHKPKLLIEIHSFDLLTRCQAWLVERGYRLSVIQTDIDGITATNFRVCHLLARPAG
ncbi:MAG: FkbM family methyltransferase [Minwuia sp.]|nr:FkbM family methyltransferase [Minwuia sp.]